MTHQTGAEVIIQRRENLLQECHVTYPNGNRILAPLFCQSFLGMRNITYQHLAAGCCVHHHAQPVPQRILAMAGCKLPMAGWGVSSWLWQLENWLVEMWLVVKPIVVVAVNVC